jgi:hypothetical protein
MPEPLRRLQAQLLRHAGGDRVMAQVLAAVPIHGLEAVLVATELVLEAGRPNAEHVLNVLARLKPDPAAAAIQCALRLKEEPRADVTRYDGPGKGTANPQDSQLLEQRLRLSGQWRDMGRTLLCALGRDSPSCPVDLAPARFP